MKDFIQEKPTLRILRELRIRQKYTFPVEKASSVKAMCSNYGLQWDKTFSTKTSRESRTITVTRTR